MKGPNLKLQLRDLDEIYKIVPHKGKKITMEELMPLFKFLGRKKREWQALAYKAGRRDAARDDLEIVKNTFKNLST